MTPALAVDSRGAGLVPWQGEAKPRFELDSLDHGRISLGDHQGRAVVVHFFATWCEPCREELESLDRLAARRHGKDLTILAVDVGEVDAPVRSFFRKNPVSFPVLLDRDRTATKAWEVMSLPTTFVLNGEFSPVLFVERDIDWDNRDIESALDLAIKSPLGAERQSAKQEE